MWGGAGGKYKEEPQGGLAGGGVSEIGFLILSSAGIGAGRFLVVRGGAVLYTAGSLAASLASAH